MISAELILDKFELQSSDKVSLLPPACVDRPDGQMVPNDRYV